jgi:hypothetical protein
MLYLRHVKRARYFLTSTSALVAETAASPGEELDILEDGLPGSAAGFGSRRSINFAHCLLEAANPFSEALPSSGSFLGPNRNIAIIKITSTASVVTDFKHLALSFSYSVWTDPPSKGLIKLIIFWGMISVFGPNGASSSLMKPSDAGARNSGPIMRGV